MLKINEDDFIVLEDGDGTVTEDAEIMPELREKLVTALKLKETVKVSNCLQVSSVFLSRKSF